MSGIDQLPPRPRINIDTHKAHENKQQQQPQAATHGHARTSSYDKSVQMADDLSAVLSQFRRRSDVEKRAPNSADPFERILEHEAEPKVEKLLFIAQSSELNPQQLLLQARAMFPDDSDLILVLREIIKRRKLRNEDTSALEEVMQQVWAGANEKHCKAGMNVGFKAQLFAKKMAVTAWALRDTYRQFLTSGEREVSQYEQWVQQYGIIRRDLVVQFIETALLHDIQSHDPSCSRAEFGALLNHVVNFKKLRSSDKAFLQVFLKRNQQQEKDQQEKRNQQDRAHQDEDQHEINQEVEILSLWLDCLQRPFKIKKELDKNHLTQLVKLISLPEAELQQKLLRAVKLLDGDLFFDEEAKEILVETLLNYQNTSGVKPA